MKNGQRHFSVKLVARNEGVEYRDANDVYRFGVSLTADTWIVLLPGTKGELFTRHELSPMEEAEILPRVKAYLEGKRYFGWFGRRFPVRFETKQ